MQGPATPRKRKNIVICCDGTGNEFIDKVDPKINSSNSNVVKLYTALIVDNDQVAYYHPGVGTAGDPTAKNWLSKEWSKAKGLAFGLGFKDNVMDAYRYLMETFNDGDRVYLFGFSRGAYTVRALAGLLYGYGLLCPGNEGHLPYAWNNYVKQHTNPDKNRSTRAGKGKIPIIVEPRQPFKETFSRQGFEVHFMGIWDTVSSVGWISTPLRLYSVAQNPIVRTGRHAVSIDERRCFYRDNLWMNADDSKLAQHVAPVPGQDLLQVWFAGVHSDIGGSYGQKESGLSNITLEWILREAESAGVRLKREMVELVLGRDARPICTQTTAAKIDHLSDLYPLPETAPIHPSLRGLWWLLECFPHIYYDKDDFTDQHRVPLGMSRRVPAGSYVHESVLKRMSDKTANYHPRNVIGGRESLSVLEVRGQLQGSIYVYRPGAEDRKPWLNRWPVRWVLNFLGGMLFAALAAAIAWLLVLLLYAVLHILWITTRGVVVETIALVHRLYAYIHAPSS